MDLFNTSVENPFIYPCFDFQLDSCLANLGPSTISLSEIDCPASEISFEPTPSLELDQISIPEISFDEVKQEPFKLSNLPKRPPNAFILFRRQLALTRDKSLSFVEFSKIAGIQWKSMTPIERKSYEDEANDLREKFKMKYPGFKVKYKPRNK